MKVCLICDRSFDDSTSHCTEESHPPLTHQPDRIGLTIGDYEIEQRLRSGAVGELYRARQIASGTSCLVRILPVRKELTSELLGEARSAAAVYHQNVADVYDSGELESGEVFVVFADLDGRTLRKELDKVGTLDLLTSIEIIRQASEGLHALHQAGLTHGAVNPENIVLANDRDGSVLVRIQNIDFGNSVSSSIVSNKFSIDSYLGRLKYFAPEQCSGQGASVQTDVYSLGIVFFEMLAGEPPFDAETAAKLIHKHKNESPPDIKINNFDLRMLVTHTLMQSLQKRPEVRHSSANAFARQLRHIEQLATHTSTPPPAGVVPPHRRIPKNSAPAAVIIGTPRELSNSAITEPIHAEIETRSVPTAAVTEPVVAKVAVQAVEQPVLSDLPVVPIPARTPRRSRLTGLKEKLHAVSEMIAASPLLAPRSATQPVVPTIAETVKPRKIELEIPEDDIPTIDEVREAIAIEPIVVDVEARQNPEVVRAIATDPVRESFVPGSEPLTDASTVTPAEAVIKEPLVDVSVAAEPVAMVNTEPLEEISILTRPVEAVVTEPSESFSVASEPARAVITEPSVEVPPVTKNAAPVTQPVSSAPDMDVETTVEATPAAVEEQPAPTIVTPRLSPPMEKHPVRASVVNRKKHAKPVVPAIIPKAAVAATPKVLAAAAGAMPSDQVAIQMVRAAFGKTGLAGESNTKPRSSVVATPTAQFPIIIQPGPDEITLVRTPRRRIRVDIDRPVRTPPVAPTEVSFQPTILGKPVTSESHSEPSDGSMFFGSLTQALPAVSRRSVFIGSGVIALMAVFLFANDSISSLFQSVSPGDSVTASANPAEQPVEPAPVVPVKQSKQPEPRNSVAIPASEKIVSAPEKAAPAPEKTAPVKEKSPKSVAAEKKSATVPERKPKKAADTTDKPARSKQPSAPVRTAPGTRPRIVREPRQE